MTMAMMFGPYMVQYKIKFSCKATLILYTNYKNLTNIYEQYISLQMMYIVTTYFSKME